MPVAVEMSFTPLTSMSRQAPSSKSEAKTEGIFSTLFAPRIPAVDTPEFKRFSEKEYLRLRKERDAAERILMPSDALPSKQPRHYTDLERERMASYESVDAFESQNAVYKDHLQFRVSEPRWFIWVFVLVVGTLAGVVAVIFISVLHVLSSMKLHLLDYALRGFPTRSNDQHLAFAKKIFSGQAPDLKGNGDVHVFYGYMAWALFSLACSLLAALLMKRVPNARGFGAPEVLAYLNGVENQAMADKWVFCIKIVITWLNIASGACMGYYGTLIQTGVSVAMMATARSRWIQFPNVNVVRCFRNPRDRRVIAVIGAAAGVGSAFSVTIGGLMIIMEQIAQILPLKFALYTFCSCLISSFTLQTYFSYMSSFTLRERGDIPSDQLIADVLMVFDTHSEADLRVPMNIFDFIPALIIGVVCGGLAALYGRISWVSLRIRRRLQYRFFGGFKFLEPTIITFIYITVTYWIAVSWGSSIAEKDTLADGCSIVPSAFIDSRKRSVIGYYGLVSSMCDPGPTVNSSTTNSTDHMFAAMGIPPLELTTTSTTTLAPENNLRRVEVIHSFASLSFGFSDSTAQMLLSWGTSEFIGSGTLIVFGIIYFLFASFSTGIAMSSDVLLPAIVIGATVGRLIGEVTRDIVTAIDANNSSWADPGVFALIGAASFMGGVTGLTFSICIILMEMTNDNRHMLPMMLALSVAKTVAERFSHPITISYLESRCVPLLDFAGRIHKYDMFCARHVMKRDVVTFTSFMRVWDIVETLQETSHNGFPVISFNDKTFKGMIMRQQLEVILWNVHWTRKPQDVVSYNRMREIEDRIFVDRLSGIPPLSAKMMKKHIDISHYIDMSTYAIQEATSLSRTYHMFRTLGLRHLVVVNRCNLVVGIITRKDLVADYMLERIRDANDVRRDKAGMPVPDGDNNDDSNRVLGWLSTRSRSRAASKAASRRLLEEVESIGRPVSTILMPNDLDNEVRTNRVRRNGGDIAPLEHLVVDETEDLEDTVLDVAAVDSDHLVGPIPAALAATHQNFLQRSEPASQVHPMTSGNFSKQSIQQRLAMAALGGGPAVRSFKERPLLTVVGEDAAQDMFDVASRSLLRGEVMEFLLRGSAGASTGGGVASARNHRSQQEQAQDTTSSYAAPSVADSNGSPRDARLAPSVAGSREDVDNASGSLQ